MPSARSTAGDRLGRRGAQRDQAAARPDGRRQVVGVRGAQQPDGPRRGLLDRLEQGVGGLLGGPVGVLEQHHPPAAADRRGRRLEHQVAGLPDAVGEPVRPDQQQVGVRADRDLAAGRALAAAAGGGRAARPANARAATDRPEPGGPVNSQACVIPAAARRGSCAAATARLSCSTTGSWPASARNGPVPGASAADRPGAGVLMVSPPPSSSVPIAGQSRTAGKLPVFSSAVDRHRVGQQVTYPRLDLPAELAGRPGRASRTR